MSWTRQHDDTCNIHIQDRNNVSALGYVLDPVKFYSCRPCRPSVGVVGGNEVSITKGNLVDLESQLYGIAHPRKKCEGVNFLQEQHSDATNMLHLTQCDFFARPAAPPPPQSPKAGSC